MTSLTPAWTERHTTLAMIAGAAAVTVIAAASEPWPGSLVVDVTSAVVFVVAIAFEPFLGAIVGLAGAAAVIAIKQQLGLWVPDVFLVSAIETGAIVLLGLLAGRAGGQLRGRGLRSTPAGPASRLAAGQSALGLVPRDLAMIRFEDEVERATFHDRPLAVLRISIVTKRMAPADRLDIDRAVSRLLDNLLPTSAVPFALDTGEMVAVLPETTREVAGDLVVSLLDALTAATYVAWSGGTSEVVGDHAEIRIGLAFRGEPGMTAGELLDAATEAVRDDGGAAEERRAPGGHQ